MFNKNQIVFIFLLLYLSAVYAEITQIKGYLFDIFKGTNGRDYDIKYIINCFNEKKNILKNDSGNYNLTIEFSQSDNYNDYVEEVKNEIKKDNYHFFLIDYKTLINDYTYYLNINNSVSDTFFYTQTIQIDEYCNIEESEYHHSNHIILDDCKINGNYYALPFTSSYNFLFYNNKLLKEFNININNNPSWSDIKNVVDEYNKNNSGNVKYGITLGLKEEEDFTGFMLEFLFSNRNISYKKCLNYNSSIVKYKDKQYFSYGECNNNNYEIFFNEYGIGNAYKEFKNLLQNNYIHPESRDLDEKQALEKFLNGESFFLRGSYDVFKEITNRNNGVTSINNDINVNTVTTTTKAPPPVTATTKAPPSSQQTTTIMNLPPKLPPKTPQTTQTISSNTIQKRNYGKVIFDNSGEYNFGVSLLPSNFSTYKGYALIGNNHQKFKDIRKAIVDVMSVLVSEQAQIKLAHDYDFLPSFDYSFYGTSVLTSLCDIIPCQTYLNSINALSLTKTLFNEESVSNSIIDSDLRNTFFEYQNKPSNEEDQYLKDSALKTLKYDLSLSYVKWLDIKSIISIVYFAFGNLYAILLIIIIAIRLVQKNNVIMQASPYLKIFYIIGLTFFFDISVLRPGFPSNLICKLGHNINYLLLGIALCCYFMKVWKINIVVNNYKFKIFNYKLIEKSSQYICSIFLSLIVTLNIFWEIFSPRTIGIKTVVIEKGNDTLKYRTPICTSEHEQLFSIIIIVLSLAFYITTFVLTYLSRKATDYYDEYKGFMYSMAIMFILSLITFTYRKIFKTYDHILIAEHTFFFISGIIMLSLTIVPKIIESFTGKTFKKSFRKSKNLSEMSFSNLINKGNFNVISFKNPPSEQENEKKFLTEEILSPFDGGFITTNASPSISNNNENNEQKDINDIPIKPYSRFSGINNRRSGHSAKSFF